MRRTPGLLLCAVSLLAAGRPGTPSLPRAEAVLDRYVRATGGRAAWLSKTTETDEMEGRSLDNDRVVLRARISVSRQGDSIARLTLPQEAQEGVRGGVAWAQTSLSGARIKHGADRDEALRAARMLEEARWRELYPRSRVEAVESVEGRECYRVALLPSGEGRTEWFDVASGMLVRKAWSGASAYSITVEEWREQDGLTQPSVYVVERDQARYRMRSLSVRYNALENFDYPAAVEAARAPGALPNAEELIERHIFESGGAEVFEHIRTQRITGTLEFVDRNLEATTEAIAADGGRYYQAVETPGFGKAEQGSDGAVAWERSPTLGPRAKRRANLHGLGLTVDAAEVVGWRYMLRTVETEAVETVDGHECYRVRLTLRSGADGGTRWYDRRTGLLYRTSAPVKTEMGTVPTVLTYLEYRDVEGLRWPVRIRMAMAGQELVFTARDVELNRPIADAAFQLPDEIREIASP